MAEYRDSQAGRDTIALEAGADPTAPPAPDSRIAAATASVTARYATTPRSGSDSPAGRAIGHKQAKNAATVPPELIAEIRLHYRLAKSAETSRIRIDHGLLAFVRVYLTDWDPGAEPADRKKSAAQAQRVIEAIRNGEPGGDDAALVEIASSMVLAMEPSRAEFQKALKLHRKEAEKRAKTLLAWERIRHVKGFSAWGLAAIIGEAGDIGAGGVRALYYRLGLAPDEAYPTGEKRTGRKIPRGRRGRVMGIIADPLLRAQWRGEKDGVPAHAIGPYGVVYGETKARALAAGKSKLHADRLARRVMVKALLHDVHAAWTGQPLLRTDADVRGALVSTEES